MVEASITGLFRTLLLILGAYVLIRFIGRLMVAKRLIEKERQDLKREKAFQREKNEKLRNFGKTQIINNSNSSSTSSRYEDVDFESVDN